MEVKDKIMYHIHNGTNHNDMWKVGNIIDNSGDFLSYYYLNSLDFKCCVQVDDRFVTLDRVIDRYLSYDDLSVDECRKLLIDAKGFLRNFNIAKREFALEECRRLYYHHMPSRKEAIWLCDLEQLKFWNNMICLDNKICFKVSVTGNLFKSSDLFIPNDDLSFKESLDAAHRYWNPDFSNVNDDGVEYLFKGKLKILEKK